MSSPLLSVRDLSVSLRRTHRAEETPIVRGVSFEVGAGETVALVGESGSGKSLTMLATMGLLPEHTMKVAGGEISFDGEDLTSVGESRRRSVRGGEMAMVYQDPMTSLNPLMRVGDQISEAMTAHGVSKVEARGRTLDALSDVGIPNPSRAARAYPHEFSGGMRQRVVIAIALSNRPRLLIADEPTTALDVTIQQQIVALVKRLQDEHGMAVVWVTHDLGVVARVADRVLVMYGGRLVESGPTPEVFRRPEHPYTAGLLGAIPPRGGPERPPLLGIGGSPPEPGDLPPGCAFEPRCPQATGRCAEEIPPLTARGRSSAACWVPPKEWSA